jgi:hypothetical protein
LLQRLDEDVARTLKYNRLIAVKRRQLVPCESSSKTKGPGVLSKNHTVQHESQFRV